MHTFLLLVFLISSVFGQEIVNLKYLHGENALNTLNNDVSCFLFVSATSDDDGILKNITLASGGDKISLYDLKIRKYFPNSNQLQPYKIQPNSYVTTSVATTDMATLGGVIYMTTDKQMEDANFLVFNVDQAQDLDFQALGDSTMTVIFLNTRTDVNPIGSTKISNWKQSGSASAYLYPGIPTRAISPFNTQIFSNPVYTNISDFNVFFLNVEPFSLSIVAFYLRTYKGCGFRIEAGSVPIAGSTTTFYTTTGFYMKNLDTPDAAVLINIMRDKTLGGTTGVNVVGQIANNGTVSFDIYDATNHYGQSVTPDEILTSWRTPHIGDNVVISSTKGEYGLYYVQYYVIQGDQSINSTTPRGIETTTKFSRMNFSIISLLIWVFFLLK